MNETTAKVLVKALQKRCQMLEAKLNKQVALAETLGDELSASNIKITKLNAELSLLNSELIESLNTMSELLVGDEDEAPVNKPEAAILEAKKAIKKIKSV
jgi:uncharacterized coiled-coil protein SlyX